MPLAIETVTDMKPEEARNHANFTPTLLVLKATQHKKINIT